MRATRGSVFGGRDRGAWPRALAALLAGVLCALGAHSSAQSQLSDRSAVVRVLQESRDFRARARAALALGASGDPTMAAPLARALNDENAAVRAAAAEGLGRVGGATQLGALRGLSRDPERHVRDAAARAVAAIEQRIASGTPRPPTPAASTTAAAALAPAVALPAEPVIPAIQWDRTRYVVVLGSMENRSGFAHPPLAQVLRNEVVRSLAGVYGVAIMRDAVDAASEREIARRHIRRYRLDGSIRTMRAEPGRDVRVRCEVSLMLMDDPGRNLRAALNGSATGTEPVRAGSFRTQQERRLAEQALQGAVRSAMNGASAALARSDGGR